MQTDCPLISTPIGDLPRLLEEENIGVLAETTTPLAFSQAIKQALEQEPTNYKDGLAIMRRGFSVEVAARELLALLFED
jgi:glycosyltransferase involved in cell wall biosynthesis